MWRGRGAALGAAVTLATVACGSASAAAPFSAPVGISPPNSNYPALAMNARGDLAVGYTNVYDTPPRVEAVTQPAGSTFHAPVALPANQYNGPLQVSVDSGGVATLRWERMSTPYGESAEIWSASGPVESGLAGPGPIGALPAFRLLANARGDVLSVWTDPNSQGSLYAAWRPRDGSFGPAHLLSREASGETSAAFEPDGRPLIAFTAADPGHPITDPLRVYLAAADADGNFAAPRPLSEAGLDVRSNVPRIATSPSGDAIVTWLATQRSASGGSGIAFAGPGTVQASVRHAGSDFGPPISLANGAAWSTDVAMNGAGDALILWLEPAGEQVLFRAADGRLDGPHTIAGSCGCTAQDAVGFDAHGNGVVVVTVPTSGLDPTGHHHVPHYVLSAVRRANGGWTPTQTLFTGVAGHGPTLFLSELGFDSFGRGAVAFGTNADGLVHVVAYDSARLGRVAGVVGALRLQRASLSVRWRLTRPALTRIQLERVAPRRSARPSRSRHSVVRRLLVTGHPGINRLLLRGPRPAPGRYRLTVSALDVAGRPLATRRLVVRL